MLKKFYYVVVILEIILFALSVGALAYFAQVNQWSVFAGLLLLCIAIFAALQYSRTRPVLDKLRILDKEQHIWAEKARDVGIVACYNMQSPAQQHERNEATAQIINKGNVFALLALSATSYIDPGTKRHWDVLRPKLEQGAPFRLLIMNPFCNEKRVRDSLNYGPISFDPRFRLDILVSLYNRYRNVDIRIVSHNIYCTLFFSEEEMIYDPYHLGKVGDRLENNFFAFRLRDISIDTPHSATCGYFNLLKNHFEYLWLNADSFELFLKAYAEELKSSQYKPTPINSRIQT